MTKELPRPLALAQLRLRSILAGVTILPTRTSEPRVWGYVPNLGPDGTFDFPVTIYRGMRGDEPRSVTLQFSELLSLARLESDSPLRAPVREQPPRLTAPPPAEERQIVGMTAAVVAVMKDGQWRTLEQLQHDMEDGGHRHGLPAISARLRDLRKAEFGGHAVDRQKVDGCRGLFRYRLTMRTPQ